MSRSAKAGTAVTMAEALASGRVTYTSSWWRDAGFYLCNNHLLLSILCAHPSHPYSRCRRLLVLLNSLSFGFFITASRVVATSFPCTQGWLGPSGPLYLLLLGLCATTSQHNFGVSPASLSWVS